MTTRCNIAPPAMATSFFEHVTCPSGWGDERWLAGGRAGGGTAAPGRNCWKLPGSGVAALPKAVSRAGFRAEVYRFPVCPPGERKYRRGMKRDGWREKESERG